MYPFHLLLLLLSALIPISSSHKILPILPGDTQISNENSEWINNGLFCDSWRLSVETNNAGYWATIPARCLGFVEAYMSGDRYVSDSEVVAIDAICFARFFDLAGNGKDAWIFDVDETLLSNLPYYVDVGFGSEIFNETSFNEWVDLAKAPALPASLKLYKELQRLGFTLVLLTGRTEAQRNATEKNLLFAGYKNWERLILSSSTLRAPAPSMSGPSELRYGFPRAIAVDVLPKQAPWRPPALASSSHGFLRRQLEAVWLRRYWPLKRRF